MVAYIGDDGQGEVSDGGGIARATLALCIQEHDIKARDLRLLNRVSLLWAVLSATTSYIPV